MRGKTKTSCTTFEYMVGIKIYVIELKLIHMLKTQLLFCDTLTEPL